MRGEIHGIISLSDFVRVNEKHKCVAAGGCAALERNGCLEGVMGGEAAACRRWFDGSTPPYTKKWTDM